MSRSGLPDHVEEDQPPDKQPDNEPGYISDPCDDSSLTNSDLEGSSSGLSRDGRLLIRRGGRECCCGPGRA